MNNPASTDTQDVPEEIRMHPWWQAHRVKVHALEEALAKAERERDEVLEAVRKRIPAAIKAEMDSTRQKALADRLAAELRESGTGIEGRKALAAWEAEATK